MPSATASFFVNSLSIAAAEAKTLAPTYGHAGHLQQALDRAVLPVRAVQRREHHVNVAERPRRRRPGRAPPGRRSRIGRQHDRLPGSRRDLRQSPAVDRQRCGSPLVSTQRPSRVMPTGTTSYSSVLSAARMLPPLTQEMACSVLRPPKTTATRSLSCWPGFRGVFTIGDPTCDGLQPRSLLTRCCSSSKHPRVASPR